MSRQDALLTVCLEPSGCVRDSKVPADFNQSRWYLFADGEARLHPHLSDLLCAYAAKRPEIDIFYGDEVVEETSLNGPGLQLCKPSFDRTQIIAQDYIGWPLIVRGRALRKLGGLDLSAGSALTYDLILRAQSEGIGIERITEVLAVHSRPPPRSNADDRAAALDRWRRRTAPGYDILPGLVDGTFQLRRRFADPPSVTLVVPTRQSFREDPNTLRPKPMIYHLLESIRLTEWPMDKLSILIGDDVEDGSLYEDRRWPFRVDRVVTGRHRGETFNYATKMNQLWRKAGDEHLVFMNDDLVVRKPDWLLALMTFAVNEEIGGVGARLLYPDDRIQHVGMPAGVLGPCTHAFIGRPATLRTYQNWAEVHREWSIVTGAVFAIRKDALKRANGFDENFPLDFNDVDLCLRLRLLGYRIVYTPFAEFTHYESASRSRMVYRSEEAALFAERWQGFLADDPAYHPRLTRSSSDITPARSETDWWVIPAAGR